MTENVDVEVDGDELGGSDSGEAEFEVAGTDVELEIRIEHTRSGERRRLTPSRA